MTAAPSRAPPHSLQTRPRAAPITHPSFQSAPVAASKSFSSRPPTPVSQLSHDHAASYYLSDKATAYLVRKTLCSPLADKNAPVSDLLPPLSSSNEVDLQLYAFIAIVIREFVYTWYAKITPDQTFVEEVVKIIAHCTRGLEQRLRKVDLEALIFDELPELLDAHVKAYRIAYYPLHHDPLQTDPRQIYHSLWPSPALSPVPGKNDPASVLIQKENEAAYRQLLVQGVLAILLPTEDFENDCLTSLVGQIMSEMILGNGIGGKASEPWLLWEGITKIVEIIQAKLPGSKAQVRVEKSISGGPITERPSAASGSISRSRWSLQKSFWIILQYGFFAFTTVRFIILTIAASSSLPSRQPLPRKSTRSEPVAEVLQPPSSNIPSSSTDQTAPLKIPILKMKIWTCASDLLDVDARMPWLSATLSMLQWFAIQGPGELGGTDGMIDKLLAQAIQTHVLEPALLPQLLRTARSALFPKNAPAPARRLPAPEEQLLMRRGCAESILALVPAAAQDVYFGRDGNSGGVTMARRIEEVEQALDVFADSYCNRHLLYGIVELILVRLMPELAEKGVRELSDERLS